jgi:hypothetical protein
MRIKNIVMVLLVAFILASCAPADKVASTETAVPMSTVTPIPPPSPTITPTLPLVKTPIPIPTSTVNPIAQNFGDPILNAIQGYRPSFEDDFSSNNGWNGTNAGIIDQFLPLSLDGGFMQTLEDGTRGYTHITIPYLKKIQSFVVTVDAAFMESSSMPRDRAIGLCWWPGDDWGEVFWLYESGIYKGGTCTSTGPCSTFVKGKIEPISIEQFVSLILIHRKGESVVYVNGNPVAYHLLSIKYFKSGFSLCPSTSDGLQSNIKYDNFRVWNLYQIPDLP